MESKPQIILFDQYRLDIVGYGSAPCQIECNLSFVSKVHDMPTIDSIPVFVLDTLTFPRFCGQLVKTWCQSLELDRAV
jgi:hypothetical protein